MALLQTSTASDMLAPSNSPAYNHLITLMHNSTNNACTAGTIVYTEYSTRALILSVSPQLDTPTQHTVRYNDTMYIHIRVRMYECTHIESVQESALVMLSTGRPHTHYRQTT